MKFLKEKIKKTERFEKYNFLLNKTLVLDARYIKSGYTNCMTQRTLLFSNVCYKNREIMDHVWTKDKNNAHKVLNKLIGKRVKLKAKIIKVLKNKKEVWYEDLALSLKNLTSV